MQFPPMWEGPFLHQYVNLPCSYTILSELGNFAVMLFKVKIIFCKHKRLHCCIVWSLIMDQLNRFNFNYQNLIRITGSPASFNTRTPSSSVISTCTYVESVCYFFAIWTIIIKVLHKPLQEQRRPAGGGGGARGTVHATFFSAVIFDPSWLAIYRASTINAYD
jgi:hypothetical protein